MGKNFIRGDIPTAVDFNAFAQLADLALAAGAALVGWMQSATGAVLRLIRDKLRESVSVDDFNAVGGGAVDDTAAFANACASLGTKGGVVRYFGRHLIDSNLTVPPNVALRGPYMRVGSPGSNTSAPYGNMAALIVNSGVTITLSSGAGHAGGLVLRKGMAYPEPNSSGFAGTAFTVAGDDAYLVDSMVLGFNKAYLSNGYQRPKVQNINLDCANGLDIQNCADISRVRDVHCWPFATIAQYALDTTHKGVIQRAGTAFNFANLGDWNKVCDCFSYAYFRGFVVNNADSMTLQSCSADSTGGFAGQLGFMVTGTSRDTRLSHCQAAAQETGYYINTSAGYHTRLMGCDSWACTNQAALVDGGDVSVIGGILRNTVHGITVTNANSTLATDLIRTEGLTGRPINYTVANSKGVHGRNDYGDLPAGTAPILNAAMPSQAVADPVVPPTNAKNLKLTAGASSFGSMSGGYAERELTLFFTTAVTVVNGGASPTGLALSGAANFSAVAGSTLTVIHDGNVWQEKGRKA